MKARVLVLSVSALVLLPSCMSPVQHALRIQQEQRRAALEADGRVAQGAGDEVGSGIAGDLFSGRLTLDVSSPISSIR